MKPAAGSRRAPGALAWMGPALLVAVGYMDPGNWAADLEGGSRFGHSLLWVLALSSALALLLQTLAARLGAVSGFDLARACRSEYSRPATFLLWVLAELGIVACDLAEVLGSAMALNLLFGLPMAWGALVTSLDVLLLLGARGSGERRIEIIVSVLLGLVVLSLMVQLGLSHPQLSPILRGFRPHWRPESAYVAIAIVGATIMPHNLYLQSALCRAPGGPAGPSLVLRLRRIRISTTLALGLAAVVNAGLLVLAASVFGAQGTAVTDLRDAHRLMTPLLGTALASTCFAVGLLAAGQSATFTGTLAGQIVMDGFLDLRVSPVVRRLITRGLAVVPAFVVLSFWGERSAGPLLIGSQVVLCMQLPFAIVPLVRFTASARLMGRHANAWWVTVAASVTGILVIAANAFWLSGLVGGLGVEHFVLRGALACSCAGATCFLAYITLTPLRGTSHRAPGLVPSGPERSHGLPPSALPLGDADAHGRA